MKRETKEKIIFVIVITVIVIFLFLTMPESTISSLDQSCKEYGMEYVELNGDYCIDSEDHIHLIAYKCKVGFNERKCDIRFIEGYK